MPSLFHVSDREDIALFSPRVAPTDPSARLAVWAIDEQHLGHYLLPRDCPRVCFREGPDTAEADRHRLLLGDPAARVIAIEANWWERVRAATMFVYDLPAQTFQLLDATAGYYVSQAAVTPQARRPVDDLPAAILALGHELRVVPDLWPVRDAVVASTLAFSVIRWRNVSPRITDA